MQNTLIHLIGFPGTGKYTIAQELCAQSEALLVDNHLINNPIFSLTYKDRTARPPKEVWDNIEKIRDIVLDSITSICPPKESFVFTNVLLQNNKTDLEIYNKISTVAKHKQAILMPIILTCDQDEHFSRLTTEARFKRYKMTRPDIFKKRFKNETILNPNHPNQLELDVTNLSPQQAAEAILNHHALLKTSPTRGQN